MDGAGPLRFFKDILLPLTRTNIAALFVILFIYGWNQYLWPLLITTDASMNTIVMGINRMIAPGEEQTNWPEVMATAVLAMVPQSEEHTSELQSLMRTSYAVFSLKHKITSYNITYYKHNHQ